MKFFDRTKKLMPVRLAAALMGLVLLLMACSLFTNLPFLATSTSPDPTTVHQIKPTNTTAFISSPTSPDKITSSATATQESLGASNDHPTEVVNSLEGCYQGDWQITNISDYATPILSRNGITNVQNTGSSGSMMLTFNHEGKIILNANQYHSLFSGTYGFLGVSVDVLIDGEGQGDYLIDNSGSIILSHPAFGGIKYSASAGPVEVIHPSPITDLIPVLNPNNNARPVNLHSTCSAENLNISSGNPSYPPLIFTRNK